MVAGEDPRLLVFSRLSEGCKLLPGRHVLCLQLIELYLLLNPEVSERQERVIWEETCTGE